MGQIVFDGRVHSMEPEGAGVLVRVPTYRVTTVVSGDRQAFLKWFHSSLKQGRKAITESFSPRPDGKFNFEALVEIPNGL